MERLTVKEAAVYIRISEYTLREAVRKKQIPHYRIGSRILFRKAALDEWIEQQEKANCKAT
ncbi:helix-turn-helix domain-containing protein [Brevibacillus sp. RS1.1]|uniref:helix-turn-helix domain-containing protein n=1 Tax=Brevibacillus sp. RS1.1 TaxID=2738982 RepID=UPI00156BB001|nr:helix-turn-helix domain-containing protein [Brevibacillus sp. RS1.1]NRR04565.1 helix-turn-helix domain-containing protein [Brevibacillus sp. RS1.1]